MSINKLAPCGTGTGQGSVLVGTVNGLVQTSITPVHSMLHSQSLIAASTGASYMMMVMIPVGFSSVRIGYNHVGGSGSIVGAKTIIASTDDIGDLSYDNATAEGRRFTVPTKSSVDYNEVSFNGWHQVTWAGVSELNISDPLVGNRVLVWSDLIDLQSIDMLDVGYDGYHALLIRHYGGTDVRTTTNSFTGQTLPQYFIDSGNNIIMNASRSGGDHVTDPSTWGLLNTPSFSSTGNLPLTIEVYTEKNHRSVLCVGDSRIGQASSSESSEGYKTLFWRIQRDMNSSGSACNTISAALGGYSADEYYDLAIQQLNNTYATDAVYLIYSINDGLPTDEIIANSKAKTLRFIKRCTEIGVAPLLLTSFPRGTGYTADQLTLLDGVDQFAIDTGYPVLSPLTIYGDTSGVWTSFNEDNDHMTPAGYDDLSSRIVAELT